MNILMFSPIHVDYPVDGGARKRIYNMGKSFQALGHAVHFVYFSDQGYTTESLRYMMKSWNTFTLIEKKSRTRMYSANDVLDACYEDHISTQVNQVVEMFDINLVWCNYIFHSKFLESLPDHVYKVIDTPEIFKDKYKIFETETGNNYTWYSYSEEDEAKAFDRADLVVAITKKDADHFTSVSNADVETIGHLELQKFDKRSYEKLTRIGFLGGNHAGNSMAINLFLEYFYRYSKLQDKVEIVVAGTVCNSVDRNHEKLTLLGRINNLNDFYRNIDLAISPVTAGTGQKIKSIEALAYGLPIVSTNEGFTGIESDDPCHHLESIAKMTSCIEVLYESPEKLVRLAQKSREIFTQYEERNTAILSQIFMKIKKDENNIHSEQKIDNKSDIIKELYRQKWEDYIVLMKLQAISSKDTQLKQKDTQLKQLDSKTNTLLNDRWYRFGKLSRKRKIWTIGKVVSKKIKLYWLLQPIAKLIKNILGK